jgi:hypothetical protein
MKTLIIQYAHNITPWKSAFVVSNFAHQAETIELRLFNLSPGSNDHLRTPLAPIYKTIDAYGSWFISDEFKAIGSPAQRLSAIITGPDEIEVIGSMVNSVSGFFQFLPVEEAFLFSQHVPPASGVGLFLSMPANPYCRFLGTCPQLRKDFIQGLQVAFQAAHYQFPDRKDRSGVIYDACGLGATQCAEHPFGHTGGEDNNLDLGYFTLETNHTGFGAGAIGATGIWSNDTASATLLNIFDHERQLFFWKTMKKIFPEFTTRTDDRIKTSMKAKYPGEDFSYLFSDPPTIYSHHLHQHVNLGLTINIRAII